MKNDGKLLEKKLQETLKQYTEKIPSFYYRFYDTKSARNFIPSQPGDFFLLIPGGCILLECKSSNIGNSLITLAHKNKQQIAKHKLWLRSGNPALYVYLDLNTREVQWHISQQVINKEDKPICTAPLFDLFTALKQIIKGKLYATETQKDI